MMTLFAYLLIGSVVAYGVFTILMELSGEIRYVRIEDDRDTEEKVIAGEETSEVALDYLKITASLRGDDETG